MSIFEDVSRAMTFNGLLTNYLLKLNCYKL